RGKIVLGRPGLGDELLVEGHVALLESLEGNLTIPEKLDSNDIKVVLAAADGKILCPPVRNPVIFDVAADLVLADPVGAGRQRRCQRRLGEVVCRVVGLGENWQSRN